MFWNPGASPLTLARTAGVLYLINILGGFFAIGVVPSVIVATGDPAATAHNIVAHEGLYRLGLLAHIVVVTSNIPLAVIFYDLFKVVNRRLAMLVVYSTLVGTAVEGANLSSQFAPLALLHGGQYSTALTSGQLNALAYLPLNLLDTSYAVHSVLFALYGVAIGYLVLRSTFMPGLIGALLIFGALCYLTYSLAIFLSPEFASRLVPYIQLPSLIGEGSLTLWLLIAGVTVQRWKELAATFTSRPEQYA